MIAHLPGTDKTAGGKMKKALLTDRWDPHSRERDRQESGQHTHELVAVKPCEGNNSGEKEQQILGSEGVETYPSRGMQSGPF